MDILGEMELPFSFILKTVQGEGGKQGLEPKDPSVKSLFSTAGPPGRSRAIHEISVSPSFLAVKKEHNNPTSQLC